jgi:hypothetical protein
MCKKPLHYLREGKIFVFDLPDRMDSRAGNGHGVHRLQHFWLCGACSQTFSLELTDRREVRLAPKPEGVLA